MGASAIITAKADEITLVKQVGKIGLRDAIAGDYLAGFDFQSKTVANQTSPTKAAELFIPRAGTYRITFSTWGDAGTCNGRIYRNGVAVGTSRSNLSNAPTVYSEDISGWSKNDLLQLYLWNSSSANTCKSNDFAFFEGSPIGIVQPLYHKIYKDSTIVPNGVGSIGDLCILTGGGASTTLYVKTGASTWTAK